MSGRFSLKPRVRRCVIAFCRSGFCRSASDRRWRDFVNQDRLELTVQDVELVLQIIQLRLVFSLGGRGSIELHLEIGKLGLRGFEICLLLVDASNQGRDGSRQCRAFSSAARLRRLNRARLRRDGRIGRRLSVRCFSGYFFLQPRVRRCVGSFSRGGFSLHWCRFVSQKWLELTVQDVELVLQIIQFRFIFGLSTRSGIELHLEIGKLDL